MKVSEKIDRAKEILSSILRHDDAPMSEIHEAANELREFINEELDLAQIRRSEKEGEE